MILDLKQELSYIEVEIGELGWKISYLPFRSPIVVRTRTMKNDWEDFEYLKLDFTEVYHITRAEINFKFKRE